jgi:hypothetical protein
MNGNGKLFYPGSQAASTEILTMTDDAGDQPIEIVNQGQHRFSGSAFPLPPDYGMRFHRRLYAITKLHK